MPLQVYTYQADSPVLVPETNLDTPSGGPRIGYTDVIPDPIPGYWKAGDEIIGIGPLAGSKWTCVLEGLGGSWVKSADAASGMSFSGSAHVMNTAVVRLSGNVALVNRSNTGTYYIGWKKPYASDAGVLGFLSPYNKACFYRLIMGSTYGVDILFLNPDNSGAAIEPDGFFFMVVTAGIPYSNPLAVPGPLPAPPVPPVPAPVPLPGIPLPYRPDEQNPIPPIP